MHETESWTLLWYQSRIRTEVASQQRKAHLRYRKQEATKPPVNVLQGMTMASDIRDLVRFIEVAPVKKCRSSYDERIDASGVPTGVCRRIGVQKVARFHHPLFIGENIDQSIWNLDAFMEAWRCIPCGRTALTRP